jgi:hypothetical protein
MVEIPALRNVPPVHRYVFRDAADATLEVYAEGFDAALARVNRSVWQLSECWMGSRCVCYYDTDGELFTGARPMRVDEPAHV